MAIKNYTTKVDVYTSIGEIQGALARHGATKIMIDYDNGKPQAIAFGIDTPVGPRGFRLPAAVDGTLRVFANQKIKAGRDPDARSEPSVHGALPGICLGCGSGDGLPRAAGGAGMVLAGLQAFFQGKGQ